MKLTERPGVTKALVNGGATVSPAFFQRTRCNGRKIMPLFSSRKVFPKSATVPVTSNLAIRAWSIKCKQKKLITQFGWKLRDERFEPN